MNGPFHQTVKEGRTYRLTPTIEARKLVPLDNSNDAPGRQIFCRGCDQGRPAKGASRDYASHGKLDIYCKKCSEE